jgi:hypothetical protein
MVVDNGIKIPGIHFWDQNNDQKSNNNLAILLRIVNELSNEAGELNIRAHKIKESYSVRMQNIH